MRDNFNTCFVGSRAVLVPYLKEHVDKYHEWMKDSYILEMTASEPLTIEEEYEMQQSWRDDQKKCTFIILSKNNLDTSNAILTSSNSTDKLGESMAGDVNLYINDYYDGNRAEIEVMIAEKSHRRKGLAKEALQMMMLFGVRNLQLSCFYAKINKDNSDSIALFKRLEDFC